jgi:hypothetical protein
MRLKLCIDTMVMVMPQRIVLRGCWQTWGNNKKYQVNFNLLYVLRLR